MDSATASPTILARLRLETRPFHEAVEANPFNQALTAGTVTTADTTRFLAKMYGFVALYETKLCNHATAFGPAWQLEQRYRAMLILKDLQQLGYLKIPPLCPTLPPLDTHAQLLGAMYVLEGSTLGGQVIARNLEKLNILAPQYFSGRGSQTGPLWKSFCLNLTAAAATEDPDVLVASASLTFQSLAAWLQLP